MVDLIRQAPTPPRADEPDRFFTDDLVATNIANMTWTRDGLDVRYAVVRFGTERFMLIQPLAPVAAPAVRALLDRAAAAG